MYVPKFIGSHCRRFEAEFYWAYACWQGNYGVLISGYQDDMENPSDWCGEFSALLDRSQNVTTMKMSQRIDALSVAVYQTLRVMQGIDKK